MAFDSHIDHVTPIKLNMDLEAMRDIQKGKGLRLTSVDSFAPKPDKMDKRLDANGKPKLAKIWTGLQSEFFGTDFSDDNAYRERWRCKCGKYIGQAWAYSGFICEDCHSPVEMINAELDKYGYIIMDRFVTFTPIYAAKLSQALGKVEGESILSKILEVKYIDDNGDSSYKQKELELMKKHPFLHKGMTWLVENIKEVLEYYAPKRPTQRALFLELMLDRDNMFTHCICVYSALLRTEIPGQKGDKEYKMKINTVYRTLIRLTNWINENSFIPDDEKSPDWEHNINAKLFAVYEEIMRIFELEYATFQQKQGIIYSKIVGGRSNGRRKTYLIKQVACATWREQL